MHHVVVPIRCAVAETMRKFQYFFSPLGMDGDGGQETREREDRLVGSFSFPKNKRKNIVMKNSKEKKKNWEKFSCATFCFGSAAERQVGSSSQRGVVSLWVAFSLSISSYIPSFAALTKNTHTRTRIYTQSESTE